MKRFIVFAIVLIIAGPACGRKGDPRAPELATPRVIKNLTAKSDRSGIVLTWSRPTEYKDGREIRDLAGFVIFRKELSQSCPDCPAPYRPLTTLSVEDREKFVKQKQYRYIDEAAQPNTIYRYRVSSQLTDGSLSEPSNEVEISRGTR
ncbi:MAG: hypothetical protein ACREQ7_09915 [Candidatus Binatia bacterium]